MYTGFILLITNQKIELIVSFQINTERSKKLGEMFVNGADWTELAGWMLSSLSLDEQRDLWWADRLKLAVSDAIIFESTHSSQPSFVVPPQLSKFASKLGGRAFAEMPKLSQSDEMCSHCMEKKYGNGYKMLTKMGWSHGKPLSAARGKLVYPLCNATN